MVIAQYAQLPTTLFPSLASSRGLSANTRAKKRTKAKSEESIIPIAPEGQAKLKSSGTPHLQFIWGERMRALSLFHFFQNTGVSANNAFPNLNLTGIF